MAFMPACVVPDKKQSLLASVGACGNATQETAWLWRSPGGRPRTSASSI
jgi:hypothetical protein